MEQVGRHRLWCQLEIVLHILQGPSDILAGHTAIHTYILLPRDKHRLEVSECVRLCVCVRKVVFMSGHVCSQSVNGDAGPLQQSSQEKIISI